MKKFRYIFVIVLCSLLIVPAYAGKKGKKEEINVEQEQQFTYYWYAAKEALAQERYADAYVLLEFCHALNPNDAQTLSSLGVVYEAIGQQEEAKAKFKAAYELAPDDQWVYYLEPLKQQYFQEKKWKKALKVQDELDKKKGYDAYSAITRFRIYAMWGKTKKAIQAIDEYLEKEPDDLRFLLFRVELLEQTGAKKEVLYKAYERVLELDPMNLTVLNNYAYHLATHNGDLQKAERMSELTIRESPDNPVFLDTYGWIMHLKGQDQLALFYLQKALWNADDESGNEIQKHIEQIR